MGEIFERPVPSIPMPFTGERLTSGHGGQTEIEHLHRYLFVREWCRGRDVLDVASGEGYGTALLAQVAKSALGVEIARDAVDHATASYVRDNLTYVQGDARAIPVPDASCDVVTSFETIEHFAEQERFIKEVRRVLRPGGLFIVSTPDRDNYSPTASAVNKYHVKEMTGAEFEALLRGGFGKISFALQRPVFGSVMLPTAAGAAEAMCFERRGATHFEASIGLARPQYIIAFASDGQVPGLPSSVYIESGQLGMLAPQEAAARLAAAEASAAAARDGQAGLRQRTEALGERVAALEADLAACQGDLTATRAEAKVLLAANEMAEKACAAYRARPANGSSDRIRQLEDDLATIRRSHSWRVTAPLRAVSRMMRRR